MARWDIVIPDETDRSVRRFLARADGKNSDLSRFVEFAVRRAVFWETLESVWKRNKHLSPDEAQALADEAVVEARAGRS